MRVAIIPILVASMTLSSCATMGGSGQPQTAMERARGQCVAAVLIGAIGGAIAGNNSGSGDARRGAQTGAIAGVGLCAVLTAMANAEDQRRLREAQEAAWDAGRDHTATWRGADGKERTAIVHVEAAPEKTWTFTPAAADAAEPASATVQTGECRYSTMTVGVEGNGVGSLERELVCRNPQTRSWEVQSA